MSGFIAILLTILFILAVITVIGHGIWVLLSLLFGGGEGKTDTRRCPFCHRITSFARERCDWCNRRLHGPSAQKLADLDAFARQLQRFEEAGAVDASTAASLSACITEERRRLLPPPTAPPKPASEAPAVQPASSGGPEATPWVLAEIMAEPVETPPAPPVPVEPPRQERPAVLQEAPPASEQPPEPAQPIVAPPIRVLEPAPVPPPMVSGPAPEPPVPVAVPSAPEPAPAMPASSPAPEPAPRRSFAEILARLTEERNIRWGELIGGMLFVCSSAALVISLWETLERIPYFQFFIFVAVSAGVFGIGLYTYHRLRLNLTGQGLLIIATLLVPLDFLAMAGLSKSEWSLVTLASESIALGIFVGLVHLAARVLLDRGRWLLVLGVVGNAAAVLLVARLVAHPATVGVMLAVACLPVACFAVPVTAHLLQLPRRRFTAVQVVGLLVQMGATGFAMTVGMGLLVAQATGERLAALGQVLDILSVPAAVAAIVVLAGGLAVIRGTARDRQLAAYHATGTMVALLGMVGMLAALGMAWPLPGWMIAVGAVNAAALGLAAFRWRLPVLHAGAIASAAVVYLIAVHLALGNIDMARADRGLHMLRLALAAKSGTTLVGLFALLGLAAEGLARLGLRRHSLQYAGGATVVALVSLLLVTGHAMTGGEDALRAAVVYAIYGSGSLALCARWRQPLLSYLGFGLLVGATMWALWWQTHHVGPWWAAMLAAEALAMAVIATLLARLAHAGPSSPPGRLDGSRAEGISLGVALPWVLGMAGQAGRTSVRRHLALREVYRIPLLHLAELLAPAALVLGAATAWIDRLSIHHAPAPVAAAACLAAVYFVLAWVYRSGGRAWAGALVALAGTVHTLGLNYGDLVSSPWAVALLIHATAALAASLWINAFASRLDEDFGVVFGQPLGGAARLSSALVVPVLAVVGGTAMEVAGVLGWLAVLWLVMAWTDRDRIVLQLHQAVLAAATLAAALAWMQHAGWRPDLLPDPLDAAGIAALQLYGIALAGLSLVWVVARIALRRHAVAGELLNPPWPSVDWTVRHLVVWAQLMLVAWHLLPGIGQELLMAGLPAAAQTVAVGPAAWLLALMLVLVFTVALWERWRQAELIAILLLAATLAGLAAGRWASAAAVASALRWTLAVVFLAASLAVWQRRRVARWRRMAGASAKPGRRAAQTARVTLLATAALPVIALTLLAAFLKLTGTLPAGPDAKSIFAAIGPTWSYLVPLGLVTIALVGHALRERSAGYAFSAGLVVEMIVTLGYALYVGSFDVPETVTLVQLATITAAVWAIAWLIARHRIDVWREDGQRPASVPLALGDVAVKGVSVRSAWAGAVRARLPAGALMNVQVAMSLAGNVLLLGVALSALALAHPHAQTWTVAAGAPLGWIALLLPLVAMQLRRPLRPNAVGLFGMAVLGLLACTIQAHFPEWGYRALMLGWASYALLVVAATWWVATLHDSPADPARQSIVRAAAVWVRLAGILAVLLGLKAAFWHQEQLWAATAIAIASGAGATMAVWRRREGWAFAAALGVNLAASLVVWHFELVEQHVFQQWWLRLVQANVIASTVVALVWLAARKRLYELRDLTLRTSPLLGIQVALPVIGSAVLLASPVYSLILRHDALPAWMAEIAAPQGWLGLALVGAAAAWYLRQTRLGPLVHVLGGVGMGVGVLCACSMARLPVASRPQPWLEYHVLVAAWTILALALLAVGFVADLFGRGRIAHSRNREIPQDEGADGLRILASSPAELTSAATDWATMLGVLVVALALLVARDDPLRPWWSLGPILAISLAAGVLAMWRRLPMAVYLSAILVNVAGTVAWIAWGPWNAAGLIQANVLCLAISAAVWTVLELVTLGRVPHPELDGRPLPLAHVALRLGMGALGALVLAGLARDLMGLPSWQVQRLDWIALGATAGAIALCLWDRTSRLALPGLYAVGLTALVMFWHFVAMPPQKLLWRSATELMGFAIATAALGWCFVRMGAVWRLLRIPTGDRWPANWFPQVQAPIVAVAGALSTWVAVDFWFDGVGAQRAVMGLSGRLAGMMGVIMLLGAAVLMAWQTTGAWRARWQYASFVAGILAQSSIGWATLDASAHGPWLHRSITLLVAASILTFLTGYGLRRFLPSAGDWLDRARRAMPVLAGLAAVLLAAVLVQETVLFEPGVGAPLKPVEIALVAALLAVLAGACLVFAVRSDLDPLGLSDSNRTLYVYAAEILLALMGLHLWLAMPWLFQRGLVRRYWMFLVMAVAFAGAGLGELFQRRRLAVLSQPLGRTALWLPLLPAIGFWFMPEPASPFALVGRTPALWFLMGLFYGIMAVTQRSAICTLLAGLTANLGLWVALHQADIGFFEHPQLWLIPGALAALVAEYLNRDRLTEAQSTGFRYVALGVIYISSTADMFITGVGENLWLPVVLMFLSVAGVLAGILLRIRSFLFLGVTFLVLDMVTVIWYAAVDLHYTWVWYASGIVCSAALIALFAIFEKRRNDVLAAVDRLKEWGR